jgi:hypothetical protein
MFNAGLIQMEMSNGIAQTEPLEQWFILRVLKSLTVALSSNCTPSLENYRAHP